MRVHGYIRVSTVEQADEGYSLAAQQASLSAHCQQSGWELVATYADEGISGKNTKRPGLQALLSQIGKGEVLMVWKLDRLSRSVGDTEDIFATLDQREASLVSVTEPHLSTAGASGVMVRQITAVFAEHYRRSLAENVKHGMAQLVKQGKWFGGPTPLGYTRRDGRLVPNADAELVRRIYAMYIGGLGVRGICTQLNAEGIKTPRGTQWSCHPMSHILRNRLYTGWIDYGARDSKKRLRPEGPTLTAKGEHEAILDVATWEQAQAVMARRKSLPSRSASGEYPLTGITRCGLCGAAIRGMKRKRGRTAVKFYRREYRCHRQTNSGTCTMQTLMGNRLEQAVLVALSQWVDGDKLRAMLDNADNGDGDSATRELAEIERRLTRWSAAYEAGAIELPEYQAKVSPLRERKRILGDELQTKASHPQHRTLDDWRTMANQLQAVWPEATPQERKELLHSTGLRVTVHPGYVVELG